MIQPLRATVKAAHHPSKHTAMTRTTNNTELCWPACISKPNIQFESSLNLFSSAEKHDQQEQHATTNDDPKATGPVLRPSNCTCTAPSRRRLWNQQHNMDDMDLKVPHSMRRVPVSLHSLPTEFDGQPEEPEELLSRPNLTSTAINEQNTNVSTKVIPSDEDLESCGTPDSTAGHERDFAKQSSVHWRIGTSLSNGKEPKKRSSTQATRDPFNFVRKSAEEKVVGLKHYGVSQSTREQRENEWLTSSKSVQSQPLHNTSRHSHLHIPGCPNPTEKSFHMPKSVESLEEKARRRALKNPVRLLGLTTLANLKVFGFYLITIETILTIGVTVGLTMYWFKTYEGENSWSVRSLDFVLVAFAVTSPISAAIGMAFQRRERALIAIADFRSFSYHLYLAHCLWDWPDGSEMGREKAASERKVNWLEHCDAVLAQLLGIGDELSRFLTLPTSSRSHHRMTHTGRKEAARTMEVAYQLIESMTTQRMTRLVFYSERLKKIGLPSGEVSRIRQYERFLSDILEQLRMVKLYRTPQALRSFGRIFTVLLPPFYAPVYAQVAREADSLAVGIAFGIITALALTALFESVEVLEDPFTAFLALDGIDAREEFEVLHFSQLTTTRQMVFPDAPVYPAGRRAALTHSNHPGRKLHTVGMPPVEPFSAEASAAGTPSLSSATTLEAGAEHQVYGHANNTVPLYVDTEHVDVEAGYDLPLDHYYANGRVSVFDDDRELLGVDDDDSRNNRTHFRRRRSINPHPVSALPRAQSTAEDSVVNNDSHHRSIASFSSAVGLFAKQKSKMRFPDC